MAEPPLSRTSSVATARADPATMRRRFCGTRKAWRLSKGAAGAAVVLAALLTRLPSRELVLPPHMHNTTVAFQKDLLTEAQAAMLRSLMKEMADFPTNVQDLKFYTTVHEHVGEATPLSPGGGCPHPFLVPSTNRTYCHLPGRIDVGRHYILTGALAASSVSSPPS